MAEENKYMDDAFRRLGEEFKVTYHPEYWEDAKTKLDDTMLDDAFKAAAASVMSAPSFEPTEGIDDMFMDSAFVDAAAEQSVAYSPLFFEQFLAGEADLSMDDAFTEAADSTVVDYLPEYWNDADKALKNEGLHYEYHSDYWKEAKRLLDKQDRRIFFLRWSAAATLLLLISFGGSLMMPTSVPVDNMQANIVEYKSLNYENTYHANLDVEAAKEALMADIVFANYVDVRHLNNEQANNEHSNFVADVNETTHLSEATNTLVNRNIETFRSVDISNDMAESTTEKNDPTFMKIGTHHKTIVRQLGFSRAIPEIEIFPIDNKPFTIHSLGIVAESGVGNRWGDFSFLPTMRNSFGLEYTVSPGTTGLQNFEFGGNFKVNHIRQNQLSAEERSNVYDIHGNVNKYWRRLQFKDMVYANLNMFVNYRFAPRHKMKFGAGVEYLSAVRSNMSYVDDFTADITTVNNNWGVKDGLNKFDLRFSVGYEYQLDANGRWGLSLMSNFGSLDRTDDDFIGNYNRDVEINLMAGLKYNLFGIKRK